MRTAGEEAQEEVLQRVWTKSPMRQVLPISSSTPSRTSVAAVQDICWVDTLQDEKLSTTPQGSGVHCHVTAQGCTGRYHVTRRVGVDYTIQTVTHLQQSPCSE